MTRPVEITQPSDFVSCDKDGKATVVFNVTDITGQEAKLGVKVVADEPAQDSWFTLKTDSIWKLGANATDQVTVDINVPATAKPGKYNFRLVVYSFTLPGEIFTKGETVCCEVKEKKGPAPEPSPFPWWIVAVVAVLVLALGGWGIWELTKEKQVLVPLPNVITKNSLAAQQELAKAGLQLDLENSSVEQTTEDAKVGTVLKQFPDPAETKEVEQGSKVRLVVAVKKPKFVIDRVWLNKQKLKMFSSPAKIVIPQRPMPQPQPQPKTVLKPVLKTLPAIGITREVDEAPSDQPKD
ncbi:MAG: PASTA domain-containing protein [Gammaproteobacteria bacterium]